MRSVERFACVLSAALLTAAGARAQPYTPELRVNASTLNDQYWPSIAPLSDFGYIIVWTSPLGVSGHGIRGQRVNVAGNPIGGEFVVNTETSYAVGRPNVATDANGNFVVVWNGYQYDGHPGIFGRRFQSNGAPLGSEFHVNSSTSNETVFAAVARQSGGDFMVVWESKDATDDFDVFGRRFSSSGDPQSAVFRVNSETTGFEGTPRVAALPNGFAVTFTRQESGVTAVMVRRFDAAGAPTTDEYRVNSSTSSFSSSSDIAAVPGGSFVVAWTGSSAQDYEGIRARRFDSGGAPIGAGFRVSTYTSGTQRTPRVAADAFGHYVIVWQSDGQDGSGEGLYGQRLTGAGAPLGGEFQINSRTDGDQAYPAVAASQYKDLFAVVHPDDDGSSRGIWFRAFCLRGDANGDGTVDVLDVFYLINFLYASGPPPGPCADVNADHSVSVLDVFYLINYLYAGGTPPI